MRCSIDSVHGRTVAIKRPCWEALPFAGAEDTGAVRGHQPPSYLDNVHANFTTPGQWYLNSSADAILYRPRPGETLSDVANSATTAGNSSSRTTRPHRMSHCAFIMMKRERVGESL